jgi:cyclophilin family peptidyl-prolyl cis-trans isomerase
MSKRSRERQLAKLAARRQAERDAQRRRRQRTLGAIGTAIAVILLVVAGMMIFNGDDDTQASPSPTVSPSASPSASPTPQAKPGKQTGTVDAQPAPSEVACGGEAPAGAGKPKPQFAGPPPMKIDPTTTYIATMVTSCGTIIIELDPKAAPQTVNSFVFLANHGFFDAQHFTRIDTSIDVLQGGDPTGTGSGGPGYSIPDELQGGEQYGPGVFAMANAGPDTGGSQFFIITGENGHNLDANPNYTIFGHITRGLDVAQRIQKLPITDPAAASQGDITGQAPKEAVYIDSVTITEKP